jgi:NitT/TauT family transport system substrate-binding protein
MALGTSPLLPARADAADPPPEVTRIRLARQKAFCVAPQYVAEALLRAEGFTDIEYPRDWKRSATQNAAAGDADFALGFSGHVVTRLDAGDPLVVLAGLHTGCYELFGTNGVNSIRDLKGKTVGVFLLGHDHHIFVSSMAAYVGLDPNKDIRWIAQPPADSIRQLAAGEIDAYLAFVPEQYELREKRIGHVVVNTTTDKPWSQYFCCMLSGNREFVRNYPVATKRVVRALVKAADLCAQDPASAARLLVENGYAQRGDYVLRTLQDLPFDTWRTHDPEDTLRFFSLRLHEVGMIRQAPHKIVAQGTDWRFLNDVKRELKA